MPIVELADSFADIARYSAGDHYLLTLLMSHNLLIVRVLGCDQKILANAVDLHSGDMIRAVRKFAELRLDGYRIRGFVQVTCDFETLNSFRLTIENQRHLIAWLHIVANEQFHFARDTGRPQCYVPLLKGLLQP